MSTITTTRLRGDREQSTCPPGIDPVRWARAPWYAKDKYFVARQKSIQEMIRAENDRAGLGEGDSLTRREEAVLELRNRIRAAQLMHPDWSPTQIARSIGAAPRTVGRHVKAMMAEALV